MRKWASLLTPAFIFAVLIGASIGCSLNNEKSGSQRYVILSEDMKFNPDTLEIMVGDTVLWMNREIVENDVTEFPDKTWTSGQFNSGEAWDTLLNESIQYQCSIHPTMKGVIYVIN